MPQEILLYQHYSKWMNYILPLYFLLWTWSCHITHHSYTRNPTQWNTAPCVHQPARKHSPLHPQTRAFSEPLPGLASSLDRTPPNPVAPQNLWEWESPQEPCSIAHSGPHQILSNVNSYMILQCEILFSMASLPIFGRTYYFAMNRFL
jgi:hypothetical protein